MVNNELMQVQSVERPAGAFQQPLTADQILAICRRCLGEQVNVVQAVELGFGTYNTTYRVELDGRPPVIVRVSPEASLQGPSDRNAMRNEYAAAPFFVGIGRLAPAVVAADFTRQVVNRDYLIQTVLAGVPAPDGLDNYPRSRWSSFYRQLGSITRQIHDVVGTSYGPVAGPEHRTWSDALISVYIDAADELDGAGLDSADIRRITDMADARRPLLDDVEARLLHGDLWHVNILIDPDAAEPTITGICDNDRASWGDPFSDWTIDKAQQRPGSERDAFWETYGPLPTDVASRERALFYRAKNLVHGHLDITRRGLNVAQIPRAHWDLSPIVNALVS